MINSQYSNQLDINISEMVRLIFNEQMPHHRGEIAHVVTVSLHIEFLKEVHKIIGQALYDYSNANMQSNKGMN